MTKPVYLMLVWLGVLSAFTLLLFGWDKLMARACTCFTTKSESPSSM